MELPSPNMNWSHSTCSMKSLKKALIDDNISAIEVDIVMGYVKPSEDSPTIVRDPSVDTSMDATTKASGHDTESEGSEGYNKLIPIMAHPPLKESDLTMKIFLYHTTYINSIATNDDKCNNNIIQRKLKKHIKLDFKEMETIQPTLETIRNMDITFNNNNNESKNDNIIFLNADILPGPAMRYEPIINSDLFLQLCIDYVNEDTTPYALSLGWRTDCRSFGGYMQSDINAMMELFNRYNLMDKFSGVVLAVNARVLVQNYKPLQQILSKYPNCQMLVWTANGEPAIPERKINSIQRYFEKCKLIDRIGFDCKITPSIWYGAWCDMLVSISSIYFYMGKWRDYNCFNNNRWSFFWKEEEYLINYSIVVVHDIIFNY